MAPRPPPDRMTVRGIMELVNHVNSYSVGWNSRQLGGENEILSFATALMRSEGVSLELSQRENKCQVISLTHPWHRKKKQGIGQCPAKTNP